MPTKAEQIKKSTYTVKSGDSWFSIGKNNPAMIAALIAANGGGPLRPGQVIHMPGSYDPSKGISNDLAAKMGLATSGQVSQFYKDNPNAQRQGMTNMIASGAGGLAGSGAGTTQQPAKPAFAGGIDYNSPNYRPAGYQAPWSTNQPPASYSTLAAQSANTGMTTQTGMTQAGYRTPQMTQQQVITQGGMNSTAGGYQTPYSGGGGSQYERPVLPQAPSPVGQYYTPPRGGGANPILPGSQPQAPARQQSFPGAYNPYNIVGGGAPVGPIEAGLQQAVGPVGSNAFYAAAGAWQNLTGARPQGVTATGQPAQPGQPQQAQQPQGPQPINPPDVQAAAVLAQQNIASGKATPQDWMNLQAAGASPAQVEAWKSEYQKYYGGGAQTSNVAGAGVTPDGMQYYVNPATGRVVFNVDKLGPGYTTPKGDWVSTVRVPVNERLQAINRAHRDVVRKRIIGQGNSGSGLTYGLYNWRI